MNVVFASGDLYSRLAVVTIQSLLINNEQAESIDIYYIGDNISEENQQILSDLVAVYKRHIEFLPLPKEMDAFNGSNRNGQTVFSYCFFQDILPDSVDKVLLLEADAVVTGSLEEFYHTDLSGCYIAAADDLQSKWYKRKLGMKDNSPYVNCGIVLYNLKKWRDDQLTQKMTSILKSGEHMFFYDVQDVINYAVEGHVKIIPPKYNCTTAIYLFHYKNMLRYRHPSTYCSEEEFEEGREHPLIVHYTKNQIIQPRPWIVDCTHPYRDYYLKVREQTSMRDEPLWPENSKSINRFARALYKNMPQAFTAFVLGIVHSFLYPVCLYRFMFRDR